MAFVTPIAVGGRFRHSSAVCASTRTNGYISRRKRGGSCVSPLTRMVAEVAPGTDEAAVSSGEGEPEVYSCKGMSVEEFFAASNGEWKSQRSSHNLAWGQFEAVTSEINIEAMGKDNSEVISLCESNKVGLDSVALALGMSWEGESDWDDDAVMKGSTVMAVVKDGENHGRLLRSVGYAEEIPAVGTWEMTPDGIFVLTTMYDMAAAEERIWFATKDLRMRVSQIRTSSGRGVVTASFSTEIRKLNVDK